MKVRSKLLTFSILFCLVFSFAVAYAATDISGHWAQETIEQCLQEGIVAGMPDGTFLPDNNITRAEFATIINKAFGFKDADTENIFSDVKDSDWYAGQVAIAAKAGYIKGYPDGTFQPQNQCTRAEASVMISKAAGLPEGNKDALSIFNDRDSIPEFAVSSVGALVSKGLIKGYPDGTFGPQRQITRAESLVMIYKASTVEKMTVTGVELNKTSISIDEETSYQLEATVKPANAANKKVEWTTSDESIATVDDTGLVKGIKAGTAVVTVTTKDGNITAACTVNVNPKTTGGGGGGGGSTKPVAVTGVEITPDAGTIVIGGTLQLQAAVKPSNATNKNVTWVSDNEDVATVNNNGLVTAVAKGTANITVTTRDGNKTDACVITVIGETAQATANITTVVTPFMGGKSFVDVTVNSTTVEGGTKWKTGRSTTVKNVGEMLRITADDDGSFDLYILDSSGDTVLATATVPVESVIATEITL